MNRRVVWTRVLLTASTALLMAAPALAGPAGVSQVIAKYVNDLSGSDTYLIDATGDFIWNGAGGGDLVTVIAPGVGAGIPLVGDDEALCKAVGSAVYCDQNKNGAWNGNGGGDFATNFSPGSGAGDLFFADLNGNGTKELIKYAHDLESGTSGDQDAFLVDDNENGVWNGAGGGDKVYYVAPGQAKGQPFSCDCDANGTIEIGKVLTSGSLVFIDLNNDGVWSGNGGGDSASAFAGGAGDGSFIFTPLDGSGDTLAKYYDNLSGNDTFQIDTNGTLVWNGTGGGDSVAVIAAGAGAGTPDGIDPDGDGTSVLMKTIGSSSSVFVDLNGDLAWGGNGGGDKASTFSTGSGAGQFVVVGTPPARP